MSLELTRIRSPRTSDYEEVWLAVDPDASYRAIIALHSTRRGPALGGTRIMRYADDDAALTDVLRLARGMNAHVVKPTVLLQVLPTDGRS
jgi:leucine dehydrogenase